jgi:hypothetical protein
MGRPAFQAEASLASSFRIGESRCFLSLVACVASAATQASWLRGACSLFTKCANRQNGRHALNGMLRQTVCRRLVGDEDVNEARRDTRACLGQVSFKLYFRDGFPMSRPTVGQNEKGLLVGKRVARLVLKERPYIIALVLTILCVAYTSVS